MLLSARNHTSSTMAEPRRAQWSSESEEIGKGGDDDRRQVKRQSSGIVEDVALLATHESGGNGDRRLSEARESIDSGLCDNAFDSPSAPLTPGPKSSKGTTSGLGNQMSFEKDQIAKQKLVTDELKTKYANRGRSHSQSEIQVSTILETDEALDVPRSKLKIRPLAVKYPGVTESEPQKLVTKKPLGRTKTLPPSPTRKSEKPPWKQQNPLKQLGRSISTRLKSKPKPKMYHEKQRKPDLKDNISDSESREKRKPLPLQLSKRLSRSMDDLNDLNNHDDGYDLVDSPDYRLRMPPKTAGFAFENHNEDDVYEKFTFDTEALNSLTDNNEKRYKQFGTVGVLEADGNYNHRGDLAPTQPRPQIQAMKPPTRGSVKVKV